VLKVTRCVPDACFALLKKPLTFGRCRNISVLKDLGPVQVEHFSSLREKVVTNETEDGDAISAVVVAIDMIEKFTTLKSGLPGKFGRKIVLLTDGQGNIEDEGDDIKDIAKRLDEIGIELLVM